MKYKVTCEYRGKVTVEVEAENAREAEQLGLIEAGESIQSNLAIYDVRARECPEDD